MTSVYERTSDIKIEEPKLSQRAAKFVRSFVERSQKYRKPHLDLAKKSRELYESWSDQAKSHIQRANLKLPYAYSIIETQHPQLCDAFLKEKPLFKFRGREITDVQWENTLTDFHEMQLEQMRFSPKFVSFAKALLLDGTAIGKVRYRFDEQVVRKRDVVNDPITGVPEVVVDEQRVVSYDGPDVEIVALKDFFPDWRAKQPGDIESMRGCVHRTYKTFNELKRAGVYKNLEELERSLRSRSNDAWESPLWSDDCPDEWDAYNDNEKAIKRDELIEVWEYWGDWDPDNKGSFRPSLITVANGDVTIRQEENIYDGKFLPFFAAVNNPRPEEFYGIPETIAVRGLIKEATVLRNARLDQANLSVNRMFVVSRDAGIRANSLYARPNGIIYSNDVNGIRPLDMPDASPTSRQEIGDLQMEIQNVTGQAAASPALGAMAKTFGRSATGAQLVSNMSNNRIAVKARMINYTAINRLQKLMFQINKQFVTEEMWVRVSDPQAAEQNPFALLGADAFTGNYDFEFRSTFDEDSDARFQKMQIFTQLAQAAEATQPGTIKWGPVFESIGRALLGREIRNFVRSDEERQMLQMQALANEQAVAAEQGRRAPQPPGGGQT